MSEKFYVPDFIHQLLNSSIQGVPEICINLAKLLKRPVIVTDTLYQIYATSYDEVEEESYFIDFEHHFEPVLPPNFFNCVWTIKNKSFNAHGYSVTLNSQPIAYIFLIDEKNDLADLTEIQPIVSYAANLCSLNIKSDLENKESKLQYKNAFLFDLIYGNFKTKAHIISYASIWHWNLDQPHAVIVFSIPDYDHYSSDQQLIKPLPHLIEKKLTQLYIDPILLQKQAEIIVIVPVKNDNLSNQIKSLYGHAEAIIDTIKTTSIGDRIACGVGQIYDNPTELFRSYQEAKVAYEIGLLLNVDIPHFGNTGLERILYKHDLQDLREYYNHTLGALEEYDEENEGELMNNLETFALNQFDLTKTAEVLFLHRNTLRYRTKKIEEILDIKLDNMSNRLNILAAFKIRQLHKDKL